jgi:hypothetical protein
MDRGFFVTAAAIYGADTKRWPISLRTAADQYFAQHPEAVENERILDRWLDSDTTAPLSPDWVDDMIAGLPLAQPDYLTPPPARRAWLAVSMLTTCALVGFATGMQPFHPGGTDPFAQAYFRAMILGPTKLDEVLL